MNIYINDKPAEITLDTEKTLGDVMSGIEQWLSPSGNRILKMSVNGREISGENLPDTFCKNIVDIEKLEVFVSSWRELAAEALEVLYDTCTLYRDAPFDKRGNIFAEWEKSSASRFINSDFSDIFGLAKAALSGEGLSAADFIIILEERLREIADPRQETDGSETLVKTIFESMENFPLDMQTGKDQHAAETVQLFSQMSEKLFRILQIYKSEGLSMETFIIDKLPVKLFVEEFNAALRELSLAYENRDTVLAGDIAEYELAPRFLNFFTALKNAPNSGCTVVSGA
jgi:hypothetical protein